MRDSDLPDPIADMLSDLHGTFMLEPHRDLRMRVHQYETITVATAWIKEPGDRLGDDRFALRVGACLADGPTVIFHASDKWVHLEWEDRDWDRPFEWRHEDGAWIWKGDNP